MMSFPLSLLLPLVLVVTLESRAAAEKITVDDDSSMITYTGQFDVLKSSLNVGGAHRTAYLNTGQSPVAEFVFTGVAVEYLASLWPYAVNVAIQLDNNPKVDVDLTDPSASPTDGGSESAQAGVRWSQSGLENTTHYVVVSAAMVNPTYVVVDGFTYTTDSGSSTTTPSEDEPTPTPMPTPSSSSSKNNTVPIAIGAALGSAALIAFILLAVVCCRRRRRQRAETNAHSHAKPIIPFDSGLMVQTSPPTPYHSTTPPPQPHSPPLPRPYPVVGNNRRYENLSSQYADSATTEYSSASTYKPDIPIKNYAGVGGGGQNRYSAALSSTSTAGAAGLGATGFGAPYGRSPYATTPAVNAGEVYNPYPAAVHNHNWPPQAAFMVPPKHSKHSRAQSQAAYTPASDSPSTLPYASFSPSPSSSSRHSHPQTSANSTPQQYTPTTLPNSSPVLTPYLGLGLASGSQPLSNSSSPSSTLVPLPTSQSPYRSDSHAQIAADEKAYMRAQKEFEARSGQGGAMVPGPPAYSSA